MDYEPFNWNVMIKGAWNRAILTPNGISKILFELSKGTPVDVLIPIDTLGPSRVKHKDLIVSVGEGFLEIITEGPNFETLYKAMEIGVRALNKLPITPVTAAGFNVRYKLSEPNADIAEIFDSPLDHSLIEKNYSIVNRRLIKGCTSKDPLLKKGLINLILTSDKNGQQIEFNFHRDSKNPEDLIKWLKIPLTNIVSEVNKFMTILGMEN